MRRRPSKIKRGSLQEDLFARVLDGPCPAVTPPRQVRGFDFSSRLANALGLALQECGMGREEVAARMSEALGDPKISKNILDKYSSTAATDHKITVERLYALIEATKQYWLIDELFAGPFDLHLVESEVMRKARLGHIEQQIKQLRTEATTLKRRRP